MLDIIRGEARPARSTRILFTILTGSTFLVQFWTFNSWALAMSLAEFIGQLMLLFLGMKYGVGGMQRIDKISYILFAVAMTSYFLTGESLLGLFLLCMTDLVAYMPTIVKNFKSPELDTPFYFVAGTVIPIFGLLAASDYLDIDQTIYPVYLMLANGIAAYPLAVHYRRQKQA
jgi:hypothetical protein